MNTHRASAQTLRCQLTSPTTATAASAGMRAERLAPRPCHPQILSLTFGAGARVNPGMKITVEFASVAYREGPDGVMKLARAIEQIGYDGIDIFDHVVMGYPVEGRPPGPYPATMPILEALTLMAYLAAATSRVTLGTEVLVLPQRHPVLVAKQVSTIDTLSGGRVR